MCYMDCMSEQFPVKSNGQRISAVSSGLSYPEVEIGTLLGCAASTSGAADGFNRLNATSDEHRRLQQQVEDADITRQPSARWLQYLLPENKSIINVTLDWDS